MGVCVSVQSLSSFWINLFDNTPSVVHKRKPKFNEYLATTSEWLLCGTRCEVLSSAEWKWDIMYY